MKTKMHSETILYHDDTGKYPNPKKSQDQIIKTKILSGHCLFFLMELNITIGYYLKINRFLIKIYNVIYLYLSNVSMVKPCDVITEEGLV